MTGRQYLDKKISVMAVILSISLAVWLYFLSLSEAGHVSRYVLCIPIDGVILCAFYHLFMIRCPRCRKSLGNLTRSPTHFSLLRFSKRVRFCPYCTIDFEDELEKRH